MKDKPLAPRRAIWAISLLALAIALTACSAPRPAATTALTPSATPAITAAPSTPPVTPSPAPTPTPSPTPEPTPEPTPDPDDIYFSDEEVVEINEERTHFSYRSPTLGVEIVQKYDEETNVRYWVSHIRTRGGEHIQTAFSNREAPGYKRFKPYRVARQYGAIYAQNGDFFIEKENPQGVVIRDGVVYVDDVRADTMAIMPDGTLKLFWAGEVTAEGLLEMGVRDALSFGPILINDGEISDKLDKARLRSRNPRSGIGMVDESHFVGIVVEGRLDGLSNGATLTQYAQMFADEGCVLAYNFDGGASSSMVFMGDSCNAHGVTDGVSGQRPVPDIVYFGVSSLVPAERDAVINDGQRNMPLEEKVETVNYATKPPDE